MSILDSSAPSSKCLIHLTACFRVSNDILNSCLSMPLLTLEPYGTELYVITRYSIEFVSRFFTRPKGVDHEEFGRRVLQGEWVRYAFHYHLVTDEGW